MILKPPFFPSLIKIFNWHKSQVSSWMRESHLVLHLNVTFSSMGVEEEVLDTSAPRGGC